MNDEPSGCPGTNRNGEPCGHPEGWGTDFDDGPCKFHRGTSPDGSSHEANGHAETYSLHSEPGAYYARQSDSEQERIDAWAESWARRAGYGGLGFDKLFHTHAVKLHQVEAADEYIANEGPIVTRLVDRTESGEPITRDEENPAFLLQSRALKDVVRFLKDVGALDDPDSERAAATKNLAEALTGGD
jgi:hypothetical protein